MLLFASSRCPLTQTNETSLASSSTNAKRRSQRSLFFTGPFGVRHLSSRRQRICQPSLKHFSMYLLSVRTSIAPLTLSSASHTAVSSIRFCVVSMALPTSCSVPPSRSINAAQPPRPATPSALQLPSVHTSVLMGRSIQSLAPSRLGVVPALVHRRPRLRANGPLAWRSVCAAPAPSQNVLHLVGVVKLAGVEAC